MAFVLLLVAWYCFAAIADLLLAFESAPLASSYCIVLMLVLTVVLLLRENSSVADRLCWPNAVLSVRFAVDCSATLF